MQGTKGGRKGEMVSSLTGGENYGRTFQVPFIIKTLEGYILKS